MPSYTESGSFPPLDGRPVGHVPPASEEAAKPTEADEETMVCTRCGREDCKHKRR